MNPLATLDHAMSSLHVQDWDIDTYLASLMVLATAWAEIWEAENHV